MGTKKVILDIPLNRVEGDLDIRITIEDGVIVDAQSIGTLYRGFENILKGRAALDALVITPRICGICSVTHLCAAVEALEDAQGITPPAQAVRLRNLSLLSETLQSDIRQFFLMFMSDFAHDFYKESDFFEEAKEHYKAFTGHASKKALEQTTSILKVVAIIGGQWPHTSHIVPGGISTIPSALELSTAQGHIESFTQWYEEDVLGMNLDDFSKTIKTKDSFKAHLKKNPNTHLARFTRYAKECTLFETGFSGNNFLSYGTMHKPLAPKEHFISQGVIINGKKEDLDIENIVEDISHSWFKQVNVTQNPFEGVTQPDMSVEGAYTWGKAPRYQGHVMQTGPLAQALVDENPLITSLYEEYSDCTYIRELARVLRPLEHLKFAKQFIQESLVSFSDISYENVPSTFTGQGVGLVEAARGALGHWINIENGIIKNYQIVTPTAWNGSPRDKDGNLGAWEKALIGLKCKDMDNPMEMGHVVRSFDPCLVCTVHAVDTSQNGKKSRFKIGL